MKTYHITLQGQDYTICLRSYSVEINGTRYKIRSLPARKLLFLTMEVDLPISGAHVMLVSGLWSMELVVDGVMLRTGKPYTPIGKIPVWAYVVSALNLAQIMNGAVGGARHFPDPSAVHLRESGPRAPGPVEYCLSGGLLGRSLCPCLSSGEQWNNLLLIQSRNRKEFVLMHEHPNSLLKVGCLLFIVGGLASALVTLAGLLLSVGSMMDSELYPYVDQMARAQSDGLIGGDEIMAVFSGFVFVMGAIAVIMLIIDLTVGILGLSRSRRPEKYRFFLGWGIPLLVIGGIGTLLTGVVTPNGVASLVCGVAAPILFIVGGIQQNKAYNEAHTPTP